MLLSAPSAESMILSAHGQKDGWMGKVSHTVVVVVVVGQAFNAAGSSTQPSQGVIHMVACACVCVCVCV
jgi:hypothetical protein